MYCGTTAYTWKTAFSHHYEKYSPGVLLIDRITDDLFSSAGIEAIDSCSYERSFMAQLWAGRRKMVDLLVDRKIQAVFVESSVPKESIEALSVKVGMVLLVLGGMHFFNLFIFSRMRRRTTRHNAPPPVAPDEFTPVQQEG